MTIDLFRSSMSDKVRAAIAQLYTPDANGRVYCGEGPKTLEFEQAFARETGLRQVPLGVNSCTAAIDLALHLIGVGVGDEVAVSAMTCSASNGPVVLRGAQLVWIDVDPITGLMQPGSLARMVSKNTKAVIAVDWAGRHCDYRALRDAVGWNIPIIEDAAHCLYLDSEFGDYVAYSFGPIKHLSTGGYGGALLPLEYLRDDARKLRWHGLDRLSKADFRCSQDIISVGYRYHMTDDQAVVGLANLELAKRNVTYARKNAQDYYEQINHPGIIVPPYDPSCDYWLHGLIVENDRDGFMARMAERGIPTSRAHARNDRHTGFAAATARQDGDLPGTTYFDDHQVNVPGGGWLSPAECDQVLEAIQQSVNATVAVQHV